MLHKPIILFQAGKLLNLSDNSYRLVLLVFSYGYVCPNLGEPTVLINIQPSSYVHISFFFFFFILDKTYTFLFPLQVRWLSKHVDLSLKLWILGHALWSCHCQYTRPQSTLVVFVWSCHCQSTLVVFVWSCHCQSTRCFRVELSLPVYSSTVHTCCFRVELSLPVYSSTRPQSTLVVFVWLVLDRIEYLLKLYIWLVLDRIEYFWNYIYIYIYIYSKKISTYYLITKIPKLSFTISVGRHTKIIFHY